MSKDSSGLLTQKFVFSVFALNQADNFSLFQIMVRMDIGLRDIFHSIRLELALSLFLYFLIRLSDACGGPEVLHTRGNGKFDDESMVVSGS